MAYDNGELIHNTSEIVKSYVSRSSVSMTDIPDLIRQVHTALSQLGSPVAEPEVKAEPAVSIKKSITPDYLICLDDGKHFKSLKRHLAQLGMTPDEYRAKWGLPSNYPMVAPSYSKTRSSLARQNGLGRRAKEEVMPVPTPAPKRARKQVAAE
jgi:predicted transcriptional regulator